MESSQLPDDLAELEDRLADRARPEPSARFRHRLLTAVRQELQNVDALPLRRSSWQFAAAVAAVVLLWANFSMSITNDMKWRFADEPESVDTKALSAELRKMFPDLPEREFKRQVLVLQGGARLPALLEARALVHFENTMKQRKASDWK